MSAPGAATIQFLGGIDEIYFLFVLTKPLILILATIARWHDRHVREP